MKKWMLAVVLLQFPILAFAGMPDGMMDVFFAGVYIIVTSVIIFLIPKTKILKKLLLALINLISTWLILPFTINLSKNCSYGFNEGLCIFADTPIILCGVPILITTLTWYALKLRTK